MRKIVDINTGWHEKIIFKQNDNDDILEIKIQKDRKEISLSGYNTTAYLKLVNGQVIKRKCSIESNAVRIEMKDLLKDKGVMGLEIIFTKDNKRVTTFLIDINIK